MNKTTPIKFTESLEYSYSTLFNHNGVFIPSIISVENLPSNIFAYYIQENRKGDYISVSKKQINTSKGIFLTKEELIFKFRSQKSFKPSDFIINETMKDGDDFEQFFGMKLSLDKQISLADQSRFTNNEDSEESNFIRVIDDESLSTDVPLKENMD